MSKVNNYNIQVPLMKKKKKYTPIYISLIILITVILTGLRIIFYLISVETLPENSFLYIIGRNRDLNFRTLYDLMDNGIFHYYRENPITQDKALYLYFWYFFFYPFYAIPLEISIYIWDLLRLFSTIYIATIINKITENQREISIFFILNSIGYFADMYLNNNNWLIQLLLVESYIQLKKENKLLSCILFTLATYKIIIIVFPFILLIVKKIKIKDIIYFFLPIAIICIPYIIFPNYFMQMASNWFSNGNIFTSSILVNLFLVIWQLIQTPHLMFISIIVLILFVNIKNEKLKKRLNILVYSCVLFFWIFIWLLLLLFAFFF